MLPLRGSYGCAIFCENRESARRRTDTHADRHTDIRKPYVYVCLSSVTFVHPIQAVEIFGNVSTPRGTLAIHEFV